MTVHYASLEDKARRYVAETIPEIFAQAQAAMGRRWFAVTTAQELHETLRRGLYLPEQGPKDEVRPVAQTLVQGGDCEDWAAVQLAEFSHMGLPVRLVTAGSPEDNFEHAYVEVEVNGRWLPSDPKGSQQGRALGVRSTHTVIRRWGLDGGVPVELPAGSGADFMDIEAANIRRVLGQLGRSSSWEVELLNGRRQIVSRQLVERFWARQAASLEPGQTAMPVPSELSAFARVAQGAAPAVAVKAVEDDKFLAALIAADLPANVLFALGREMGLAGTDAQLREGVADYFALAAKMRGLPLRAWLAELGLPAPAQADVAGSGFVDFRKLSKSVSGVEDVAKTKLRAVQTGVGVALQQVGAAVAKLEQRAPWAGQFFLRPLGLSLTATAIGELGNAVRDGSLNAFDEKALARSGASWFRAVGQALAVAAPFTGPWAPLFTAAAAFNVAVGQTIDYMIDKREAARQGPAQVRIFVDEQGRQVDAAGNLVDPTQRAIVAAQLVSRGLSQGQDGFWYGYVNFGPEWGQLWAAHNGAGRPLAAWVNGEWVKVQ